MRPPSIPFFRVSLRHALLPCYGFNPLLVGAGRFATAIRSRREPRFNKCRASMICAADVSRCTTMNTMPKRFRPWSEWRLPCQAPDRKSSRGAEPFEVEGVVGFRVQDAANGRAETHTSVSRRAAGTSVGRGVAARAGMAWRQEGHHAGLPRRRVSSSHGQLGSGDARLYRSHRPG